MSISCLSSTSRFTTHDFYFNHDVESVADVITVIQHPLTSLKKFEMHIGVLTWAEAEQLFHALSRRKACQTLEDIVISSRLTINETQGQPYQAVKGKICS